MELISIVVAGLALGVSLLTAYLTLLRRGTLRMTRPTLIFFGPDGYRGPAKIFLRTLLFASSDRGVVLENLYLSLKGPWGTRVLDVWAYGARKELERGSGLFVGRDGVSANHHFLPSRGADQLHFDPGKYRLEVFATLIGRTRTIKLFSQDLEVSHEEAGKITRVDSGLFFDWAPEEQRYVKHLDRNRAAELNYMLDIKPPDLLG